jgi:hypothetical protein
MSGDTHDAQKVDLESLFTVNDIFPELKSIDCVEIYSVLRQLSDSMRLEQYLLCVEAWSELCMHLFPCPDLRDLQTIAQKWCRVERDKLYQLSSVMKVEDAFTFCPEKIKKYTTGGRFLQDIFFAQGNNQVGIPRCCDVILDLYLHDAKTIRQFQPLAERRAVDASSSMLQTRLANQHAFLELVKRVGKLEANGEAQRLMVHISEKLKLRLQHQQVNMAKLHYLAMEYMYQGCTNSLEFDPEKVFVFRDLPEFSEFPVTKFYENFFPDIRSSYVRVSHGQPQRVKLSRTHETFVHHVHKVGLNNTSGQFLLPYVKMEMNGWWKVFGEVRNMHFLAFPYHRKVQIDLKNMFQNSHEKDLNWLYTQIKHVFESFRQFRYAMLKCHAAESVAVWNTTHLLNSNMALYSELSDLKRSSIIPDDIVHYLSSVEAFCMYPQMLNLLEKVTKSTDQIDIFNINPIVNGIPLEAESFANLAFWLRDRSRFGTVKHETVGEFFVLREYWKSCEDLRMFFRECVERSYESNEFKRLIADPMAIVYKPMQLTGYTAELVRAPMHTLKAYPELHDHVDRLPEAEKILVLLFVVPFQLLRLIINNLDNIKVDVQYSVTSSMVVQENFATVQQFAGELLMSHHLWEIGKNLTHQLTTWQLHRNLVNRVVTFTEKTGALTKVPSTLPLVHYWDQRRQPPEFIIRSGGVVRKSVPNNSHSLHEFIESNFSLVESFTDEPLQLKPYRLALENMLQCTVPNLQAQFKQSKTSEGGGGNTNVLYLTRKIAMRSCDENLYALYLLGNEDHPVFYLQCCFLYCRMLLAELVSMRKWNVGNKILQDVENCYLTNILWRKDRVSCLYSSAYQ